MKPSKSQKKQINKIASSCVSVRLRLINRIITSIFDEALRHHGVKASQITILVAISGFKRTTSKELCKTLHMDTSTFSRALAILKKHQWVYVEPSGEGKILKIDVTEKGFEKIEEVYPDWELAQQKATEVLGLTTTKTIISSGTQQLLSGMII